MNLLSSHSKILTGKNDSFLTRTRYVLLDDDDDARDKDELEELDCPKSKLINSTLKSREIKVKLD